MDLYAKALLNRRTYTVEVVVDGRVRYAEIKLPRRGNRGDCVKQRSVRLTDEELQWAEKLGGGNVSEGVRTALQLVAKMQNWDILGG